MGKSTIDWKSMDSHVRLLASVVASNDLKLNYTKIASMYGQGATYDSIEGRFRVIRKEALKLKDEIDSGVRSPAPARNNTKSNTTPRKPRAPRVAGAGDSAGVIGGRVSKSANTTPTKRRTNTHANDILEASTSTSSSGDNSYSNSSDGNIMPLDELASFDPSIAAMSFDLPNMSGRAHHDDGMGMSSGVAQQTYNMDAMQQPRSGQHVGYFFDDDAV